MVENWEVQEPPVVGMERTWLELSLNTGCSLQRGEAGAAGQGAGGWVLVGVGGGPARPGACGCSWAGSR